MKALQGMNSDTQRLNAIVQECAEIELTCGGVWRVSSVDGDFEGPNLRAVIDNMMTAAKTEPGGPIWHDTTRAEPTGYKRPL